MPPTVTQLAAVTRLFCEKLAALNTGDTAGGAGGSRCIPAVGVAAVVGKFAGTGAASEPCRAAAVYTRIHTGMAAGVTSA